MKKFPLESPIPNSSTDIFDAVIAQEKEAFDFGFYWENLDQVLDQVRSECGEIKEAFEAKDLPHFQEELGDLLHAAVSLCIFCGLNPKEVLDFANKKFERRLHALKEIAQKEGFPNLKGQNAEILWKYWEKAKKAGL